HLITGRNYTEGAQVLRIALQLEPQNKQYMLTRAQLQARMKDYAAAKKTLEPLLAADADPGLKASADSLLKWMSDVAEMEQRATRPASESAPDQTEKERTAEPTSKMPDQISGQTNRVRLKRAGETNAANPNAKDENG